MAIEYERKFLISDIEALANYIPSDVIAHAHAATVRQVYLSPKQTAIGFNHSDKGYGLSVFDLKRKQTTFFQLDTTSIETFHAIKESGLGLLNTDDEMVFDGQRTEIRIGTKDQQGFLTIKQKTNAGAIRHKFEFEIPWEIAAQLQTQHMAEGTRPIEKHSTHWTVGDIKFGIDEYLGENSGLHVLEIENPPTPLPLAMLPYSAVEITHHQRFNNRQLAENPFSQWDHIDQHTVSTRGMQR